MSRYIYFITSLFFILFAKSLFSQTENGWTIMYYAVGSNSSEVDLLSDIDEMIRGKQSSGYELITLIDRVEGFSEDSTTLGENFTDTRLYRIDGNSYQELDGKKILHQIKTEESFEANMADVKLLKQRFPMLMAYTTGVVMER